MAKKKSLLPHGFMAKADRKALALRKELGLLKHSPLCGFELANHFNISVYKPYEFFPEGTDLTPLLGTSEKNRGWSALTMKTEKGNRIIIHNDLHAPARQQSDMMHELSHFICEHEHPKTRENIRLPFFMREYNPQQEEEANYLGGALQITRDGLIWCLTQGMSKNEIADYYNASSQMVTYRINTTGVQKQMNYRKKYYARR